MTDMQPDKIKPEHSPWYLLATLYNEAASADDDLHARNRTAWNRFMAAELTEDTRALLIKEGRCSEEELKPFSTEELDDIEKLFAERYRQATGGVGTTAAAPPFPNVKRDRIDFSNVEFDRPFWAKGFFFPIQTHVDFRPRGLSVVRLSSFADFLSAKFSRQADFSGATFFGNADFSRATFSSLTHFQGATFSGRAGFKNATFSMHADFRGTTFSKIDFSGAAFDGDAYFSSARFFDQADFLGTAFSAADFSGATFSERTKAKFSSATFGHPNFSGRADFWGAKFSGGVHFEKATSSGRAGFENATFGHSDFSGGADFWGAKFSRQADFSGATFENETSFVNAEMEGPTSFKDAEFNSTPPQFFGAKLHEGTVWRGVNWSPPPNDHKEAGRFVDAYERLKLEMDRLKKHEDELNFFAFELQSRRVLQGDWEHVSELRLFRRTIPVPSLEIPEKTITLRPAKLFGRSFALPPFTTKARTIRLFRPAPGLAIALYGWLSDYGRSYVRPLYGLLMTVVVGVPPFWWHLCGFCKAVGLSFANTFGVLGFRRELIGSEVMAGLPSLLKVVAASQTIAGIVLLFLFGLAIRNRFRIK